MSGEHTSATRSIHDRLLARAKAERLPFNQVFTAYVLERLLYRVGASPYADQFVLKGGLMMRVLGAPLSRATRDADLEGFIGNDPEAIATVFKDIVRMPCPEDGLCFDADRISAERIVDDAEYGGVRVLAPGTFGSARYQAQIDIGFGDPITPHPVRVDYPCGRRPKSAGIRRLARFTPAIRIRGRRALGPRAARGT